MSGHVKSISYQRNRAKPEATNDFREHHCGADRDDTPRPALVLHVRGAEKNMSVAEILDGARVHGFRLSKYP